MSTTVYLLVQVVHNHRFNVEAHCLQDEALKKANHLNADPGISRYDVEAIELHETYVLGGSEAWNE